jgi:prevent-host-death family protein
MHMSNSKKKPTKRLQLWKVGRVSSTEARRRLPELVNAAFHGERFIIDKNGLPVAALVPFGDLGIVKNVWPELEERHLIWKRVSDAFADVPQEEFEREAAAALAEARADIRRERAEEEARKASSKRAS